MAPPQDANSMSAAVGAAFGPDEELRSRVAAACRSKELTTLFNDIARYILDLKPELKSQAAASKKRPIEEDSATSAKKLKMAPEATGNSVPKGCTSISWTTDSETSFEAADISFVVPVRKKLRLELVGTAEDGENGGIRGVQPTTGQYEVGMTYNDVDQVILVPVPEKPTPQFNFILIPRPSSTATPIVFTIPSKRPKDVSFREPIENDTYELYIERAINSAFASTALQVISPAAAEFESKSQQGRRKGERLWHVNAHRGSKEGYLYFLETGILWGFKKPVVFLGFDKIKSISYTSVLQRTFNMVVTTVSGLSVVGTEDANNNNNDSDNDIEFSMLDQIDFEGIDAYIKRHGLNDASLAESRRAKQYNVNAPSFKGDIGEPGVPEDKQGQMSAKDAERELQDAEDAEEEDYEVSGGESEGSGSESEEGEGEEGDDGDEGEEEDDLEDANGDHDDL